MAHCYVCGEDYGFFHIHSVCKCVRDSQEAISEDKNFNNGVDMRGMY